MKIRHDMACCYVLRLPRAGEEASSFKCADPPANTSPAPGPPFAAKSKQAKQPGKRPCANCREEAGILQSNSINSTPSTSSISGTTIPSGIAPASVPSSRRDAVVTMNEEHDAMRWMSRADIDRQFIWPGERRSLPNSVAKFWTMGRPSRIFASLLRGKYPWVNPLPQNVAPPHRRRRIGPRCGWPRSTSAPTACTWSSPRPIPTAPSRRFGG